MGAHVGNADTVPSKPARKEAAKAVEPLEDLSPEQADLLVDAIFQKAGGGPEDPKFKVQLRKQGPARKSIAVLFSLAPESKKWSQCCQLVVKDPLVSWSAMLLLKQLAAQLAAGNLTVENLKAKRDDLLGQISKGQWLEFMVGLGSRDEWFTSQKFLDLVSAHYVELPPPGITRSKPLEPDAEGAAGSVATASTFKPQPPVENPDRAETQLLE